MNISKYAFMCRLAGHDQQLALALVQRDLDRNAALDDSSTSGPTEKSDIMPPLVLKELHENLIHAYSEVEVMHDLLSKVVDTRKQLAGIDQRMTLCSAAVVPSSGRSAAASAVDAGLREDFVSAADLKQHQVNMAVKHDHLAQASDLLRKSAVSLVAAFDRELDLFNNQIFPLLEAGWILHLWKGRLCVKYGPAADQCVPVDSIRDDISQSHIDKRLRCEWKFNGSPYAGNMFSKLNVISSQSANSDGNLDAENSDISLLKEAERTVLDDGIFYRLYSDAMALKTAGMQRLASIEGTKVLLPITADMSLEISMERKEKVSPSQIVRWTIDSMRRLYIEELSKTIETSSERDFAIRYGDDEQLPLLLRLVQHCQFAVAFVEANEGSIHLKHRKFNVELEGWPNNAFTKSFRLHVSKADDKLAITRHLGMPHWQLSSHSRESWNTSDYIGTTTELFEFISCGRQ